MQVDERVVINKYKTSGSNLHLDILISQYVCTCMRDLHNTKFTLLVYSIVVRSFSQMPLG